MTQTPAEEQFTDNLFLTQESSEGLLPSLMKIGVSRISMKDYELYYCDKDKLKVKYLVENLLIDRVVFRSLQSHSEISKWTTLPTLRQ